MKHSIFTSIFAGLFAALTLQAGEVHLINGQIKVGPVVPRGDGSVTVNTAEGTFTYKPSQYKRAIGDRPAEFDAALSAFRTGNMDGAISNAKKAMQKSAFLDWDAKAASILAEIYIRQDKGVEANQAVKSIKDRYLKVLPDESAVWDRFPKLESVSWRGQTLQASKHAELEKVLDGVIKDAENRERAAFAQMVRGDLRLQQKRAKEAVLDYLRTVYFFSEMEDVHPEAIYKTGKAFEAMQNTKRATEFYNRLASEYPDSSYAAEVAGK